MTKISSIFGVAAAASLAHAQSSTTVSLLLPDTDSQSLVASVVAAEPSATTFLVNCPDDTDSDACGIFNEFVTKGKDFFAGHVTDDGFTETWSCDVAGTTSASCFSSDGGPSANFPGSTTTVLSASEITYMPVVITAGAEKLKAGATATGSGSATSSASGTGASASITTAPLLFPEADPDFLLLSVVSAGDSTTVYKLGCNDKKTSEENDLLCPFGNDTEAGELEPWLTMAPNFFGMNLTGDAGRNVALTVSCSVSSTSLADCVERMTGTLEGSTVTSTVDGTTTRMTVDGSVGTSTTTTKLSLSYGSATITGGLEKLAQATGSNAAAPRETGLGLLVMAAAAGAGMLI